MVLEDGGLYTIIDNHKELPNGEVDVVYCVPKAEDLIQHLHQRYPNASAISFYLFPTDPLLLEQFTKDVYQGISLRSHFRDWLRVRFRRRGAVPLVCTANSRRFVQLYFDRENLAPACTVAEIKNFTETFQCTSTTQIS